MNLLKAVQTHYQGPPNDTELPMYPSYKYNKAVFHFLKIGPAPLPNNQEDNIVFPSNFQANN